MQNKGKNAVGYSIAPWLSVNGSLRALAFYKEAFGATEVYRLDVPDGIIARLSVNGADFWISDGSSNEKASEGSIRMILTVPEPESLFKLAIKAGAKEIYPVGEQHGWKIGRIEDPFGHHWEIGVQIGE